MANKKIKKIPIKGEIALKKIKEKYGTIKNYANQINMSDRSVRNYIDENAIPNKNDVVIAFSELMDEPLFDLKTTYVDVVLYDVAYNSGFKAGYEKCLSELQLKFNTWIDSLK